jgi:hypothetical protein
MIFGRKSPEPEVGQDVMTADEEHLGDVVAVRDDYLEVASAGLGRRTLWRVPRAAIGKVDDAAVHLTLSRGQVLVQGWEHLPSSDAASSAPGQ